MVLQIIICDKFYQSLKLNLKSFMITIGMLKVLLTQTFCVVYNQSYSDTVPYKATLNDLHCTDYLMPGTKLMVQIPGRPRN